MFVHGFQPHVKTPQPRHVFEHLVGLVVERTPLVGRVAQRESPVALQIDRPDLDVGFVVAQVVLVGQALSDVAVARRVVDGGDGELAVLVVVEHGEEVEIPEDDSVEALGEVIDAATALDWGIAAYLAEGPALAFAEPLAARLAERAPLALMAAKAALWAGSETALALNAERKAFAKSNLEVSTEERVKHCTEIVPSFTITFAILLEVSTKSSISADIR